VHHYNGTQYCSMQTVLLIFPFLQTNITFTSQRWPSGCRWELSFLSTTVVQSALKCYKKWAYTQYITLITLTNDLVSWTFLYSLLLAQRDNFDIHKNHIFHQKMSVPKRTCEFCHLFSTCLEQSHVVKTVKANSRYILTYEGRSLNKLQNGIILLIFRLWKFQNIHFVGDLILSMSYWVVLWWCHCDVIYKHGNIAVEIIPQGTAFCNSFAVGTVGKITVQMPFSLRCVQ